MNYRLLWDWEQASGFDAKQAEEMRLEQGRFGQFHEPRGGSSLPTPQVILHRVASSRSSL
jgi:hypothetical protein